VGLAGSGICAVPPMRNILFFKLINGFFVFTIVLTLAVCMFIFPSIRAFIKARYRVFRAGNNVGASESKWIDWVKMMVSILVVVYFACLLVVMILKMASNVMLLW
jgi:hypothetical protein